MKERYLIPNLILQVKAIKEGVTDHIELSRLDSKRDYIDVRDIAKAFRIIAEDKPTYNVYNVGSGSAVANGQLLDLLLKDSNIKTSPKIIETAESPEPQFATQADISRIQNDLGWHPSKPINQVIKEIVDASS